MAAGMARRTSADRGQNPMRYSFMSFSCPELSLQAMLDTAADLGYAGIEPRVDANHAHGVETSLSPAQRRDVRARVADSAADICCIASSSRYSEPATLEENLAQTRREIALAGDLGVPVLRVFGGQIADGIDRDAAIDNLSAALARVADEAGQAGVTVCVETHDAWCNPHHVAAVLANVNHPAVAANWDVLHPVRAEGMSVAESLVVLGPWIRHVHMHDATLEPGRIQYVPMGTGAIDHREVIQGLREIDYNGCLSGEWIGYSPWQEHLPYEIGQLRRYEADFA
ncbi:MAG: sugar phosphate isomerase/epimerase [Caldilineaceae bacterium SB0664_bin_22]|nr:sugar phosphate isomerase/epimerase [Caldilineaceae bacterium SB0664_bin_22]MYC62438.1 sugar phosphate isomerase/epimerase [Caldilineaceae bacterium SB0661_bin_34]